MEWQAWVLIGYLAVSWLIFMARCASGRPRYYTVGDAISGMVEYPVLLLLVWSVAS